MGFNNPRWTWSELEAALSGRSSPAAPDEPAGRDGRTPGSPSWNAGGDGPAWTRHRQPFDPDGITRRRGEVPYAELHCHSNYSFGDGASHPEELVREAAELGLEALALTDHHGFYGIVRFAEAAGKVGLPTIFGTEITLTPGLDPTARITRSEDDTLTQVATGRVPDSHAPDPTASTCCCSPTSRRGTPASRRRSASVTSPGRRAPRSSPSPTSPPRWRGTRGCSPAAARAPCPLHSWPRDRRRRAASCAG